MIMRWILFRRADNFILIPGFSLIVRGSDNHWHITNTRIGMDVPLSNKIAEFYDFDNIIDYVKADPGDRGKLLRVMKETGRAHA